MTYALFSAHATHDPDGRRNQLMLPIDRDRTVGLQTSTTRRSSARLLATLNHPHIGAIYRLEDAEGACLHPVREMTTPLAAFLGSVFGRPGLVLHGESQATDRASGLVRPAMWWCRKTATDTEEATSDRGSHAQVLGRTESPNADAQGSSPLARLRLRPSRLRLAR